MEHEKVLKQKKQKRKTKRGGRKHKKNNIQEMVIFSTNAEGMKHKLQSLNNEIKSSKIAIFTLQETHFRKKGNLKIDDFEIFEAIRKKPGGGTVIGAHKTLTPVLIEEYNDDFELLVIEVKIADKEIRIITGYGPQESWPESERAPFFQALEKEIVKAELNGKSMYIGMDSNSKLGPKIIPQDPHEQSANGKILQGIIDRHGLVVANGLPGRHIGLITRRRKTQISVEESVIDHVIVSEDLVKEIETIEIDEKKDHALTKVLKTKNATIIKSSDHNPILTHFKIKWCKKVGKQRIEMFNLKNKEGQEKFKILTTETNELTEAFNNDNDINVCTKNFIKILNKCISRCFKKIRIVNKPNKEVQELFEKRKILKNRKDEKSKHELIDVENKLADLCASSNYAKIEEEIEGIKPEDGGFNSGKLWKLKKKISPKCRDPPTAMVDDVGNIVTSAKAIEALALETYSKRLENRKIKDGLENHKKDKENLCKLRLEMTGKNRTSEWSMNQLEVVLKYLKKNKSRDPFGYSNDLFRIDVAGDNLKDAILILMNRIKAEQVYPVVLEDCDITSIYKNKGARNCFESYRGIFRVSIFRTILDRLIYNDEYKNIDQNLTDSNVGARKKRNIRDNIFVLNAINNSVVNGTEEPVDIQVFDVEKCFDSLWLEECINDIYETGFTNDKLNLLYLENQNANIAIKSQEGKSSRKSIKNVIMQGTVWGSLMCTSTMDKLAKIFYKDHKFTYKYKGNVETPCLGMVDDILCIQKCSALTAKVNAVVNAFIEGKKLKLSKQKCSRIHIKRKKCKNQNECLDIKVHEETMKNSNKEKYLGDLITNGTIRNTIEERKNKGFGIINEIMAILDEIPLGRYKMEIGLRLRQAMLVNGMLYNSEAWHAVSEIEIRMLEAVDETFLRGLVNAHSKTPLEFLYLEAGVMPIRFIISARRLSFHQTILKRNHTELTNRIYEEQKRNPTTGDFTELIKEDFKLIGEIQNDEIIRNTSISAYKSHIKSSVKSAAFKYLKKKLSTHTKVQHIQYKQLEIQQYMTSPMFTNGEVDMLHALRSRCTDCKVNFKQKYIHTNLKCSLCDNEDEDQQHILVCTVIKNYLQSKNVSVNNVIYQDIFSSDITKQKEITTLYMELFKIRTMLLNDSQVAPSSVAAELTMGNDLHLCIDNPLPGN